MKKSTFHFWAILLMCIAFCFVSCGNKHQVKLSNGSVVTAMDIESREYKQGDTVCISRFSYRDWQIDNNGRMMDTIMYREYTNSDGDTTGYFSQYTIGIIQ